MLLSTKQQEQVKEFLLQTIEEKFMPFPDVIETERVYAVEYFKYESRGSRDLKFIVNIPGKDLLSIDLYFSTDDYSTHKRIDGSGSITDLENFEGQFGWPVLENEELTRREHQRIKDHNAGVLKVLQAKGFLQ